MLSIALLESCGPLGAILPPIDDTAVRTLRGHEPHLPPTVMKDLIDAHVHFFRLHETARVDIFSLPLGARRTGLMGSDKRE